MLVLAIVYALLVLSFMAAAWVRVPPQVWGKRFSVLLICPVSLPAAKRVVRWNHVDLGELDGTTANENRLTPEDPRH